MNEQTAAAPADPREGEVRTPQGYMATPAEIEAGKVAAAALATIEARQPAKPERVVKQSELGGLAFWALRPGVTDVIAYWSSKIPTVHNYTGKCIRAAVGTEKTENREWLEETYAENVDFEAMGKPRDTYFCTRCVLTYGTQPQALPAGAAGDTAEGAEIERRASIARDGVTGELSALHGAPCPECGIEMSLTGECNSCSLGAPAAKPGPVRRVGTQRKTSSPKALAALPGLAAQHAQEAATAKATKEAKAAERKAAAEAAKVARAARAAERQAALDELKAERPDVDPDELADELEKILAQES